MPSRHAPARTVLGLIFLVFSHTQMVAMAQQAMVNAGAGQAGAAAPAVTSGQGANQAEATQAIVEALSQAFGAVASNMTGPELRQSASSTDMAQSAAALKLADAYQSALGSLQFKDIGDGANLKRVQAAAQKLRVAFKAVSGVLGPDAVANALGTGIKLEQLLLQTVGTALGDLGLVSGMLALAGFIMVTIGGAFYIAGSSVLLAINIQGLQAATGGDVKARSVDGEPLQLGNATGANGTFWWEQPWFKEAGGVLDEASTNVINWAFNEDANNALDVAIGLIDTTQYLLKPGQEVVKTAQDARDQVAESVGAATSQVASDLGLTMGSMASGAFGRFRANLG